MTDQKNWSALFNAHPSPTILLTASDNVYTIAFANKAFVAFSQLTEADIVGNELTTAMHQRVADIDALTATLTASTATKTTRSEFNVNASDGTAPKYVDIVSTPAYNDDSKTAYIICIFNDVTDLVLAQQTANTNHNDRIKSASIEQALIESRNQYQALIESLDGVVWEAEASSFNFTFISNKINDILGYTPEQWLSDPHFWVNHIVKDDRDWAVTLCQAQTRKGLNHSFDYRMVKADGGIVWIKDLVSVITEKGKPKLLRGVMIDITQSKLLANLDSLERGVLEAVANKTGNLQTILLNYLKGIEGLLPQMQCSLLQVQNHKLYTLAAPSLPKTYINAINGQEIGTQAGSCGTSAYLKKEVIVADISTNHLWANYKHLALAHNLKACWSSPILDSDGEVMAVLGMYYNEIKQPSATDKLITERSIAILKVILENRQRAKIIDEATLMMQQGQELANFGNWQWDIKNNTVQWSDVLYNIYGVSKNAHIATYESYLSMLHPDDREFVKKTIFTAIQTQQDIVFEERIIRPDGELRHLRSWGRVLCDDSGTPEKMIGSCLDITASKIAESQLWEIAWMQSHLVRAPLARLMGLIAILKDEQQNRETESKLLDYIMNTTYELDQVVNDISNKTVTGA